MLVNGGIIIFNVNDVTVKVKMLIIIVLVTVVNVKCNVNRRHEHHMTTNIGRHPFTNPWTIDVSASFSITNLMFALRYIDKLILIVKGYCCHVFIILISVYG